MITLWQVWNNIFRRLSSANQQPKNKKITIFRIHLSFTYAHDILVTYINCTITADRPQEGQ